MSVVWKANQRIVSRTEPSLGLGLVLRVNNQKNLIEVSFDRSGDVRRYSMKGNALQRFRLKVGQTAHTQEGDSFVISKIIEEDDLILYRGQNKEAWEWDLDDQLEDQGAIEQLIGRVLSHHETFDLRKQAWEIRGNSRSTEIRGLVGPKVMPLPHQLYVAHEVCQQENPRVLLADEVGLGKTIEAGLIFSSLRALGRADRVLIVVPESLKHQWLAEMFRRFNELFTILDEDRCLEDESSQQKSPFATNQKVLCSMDFFMKHSERLVQASQVNWDLTIVDEAHHLRWSASDPGPEWMITETLSEASRALLFLTATPRLYGLESQFGLLTLADPGNFSNFAQFEEDVQHMRKVAQLAQKIHDDKLDEKSLKSLKALFPDDEGLQRQLTDRPQSIDKEKLLRSLIDRHGTGRIFYRNRRERLKGFPKRKLKSAPLTPSDYYLNGLQKLDPHKISNELLFDVTTGNTIELIPAEEWHNTPRANWLRKFAAKLGKEKALVICSSAEQVLDLSEYMEDLKDIKISVFHEHLSIVERDQQAARFSEPDGSQILLCSEIGGEGRNFQFASHLVLYDLPGHPDLVEQRIGRLDRIGQGSDISIHVPWLEGTPEEVLFRWYDEGLNSFKSSWNGASAILDKFQKQLIATVQCYFPLHEQYKNREKQLEKLIEETKEEVKTLKELNKKSVDILVDLNSFDEEKGRHLVELIENQDDDPSLEIFVRGLFDHYGVDYEDYDDWGSIILKQDALSFIQDFPKFNNDEDTLICFDRSVALKREEMTFLTQDHPMTEEFLSFLLSRNEGVASMCKWEHSPHGQGAIVELSFILEAMGPKFLEIDRYLPLTVLTRAVKHDGSYVEKPAYLENPNLLSDLKEYEIPQDTEKLRAFIEPIVAAQTASVEKWADEVLKKALSYAHAQLTEEQERLKYLVSVNKKIPKEELKFHKLKQEQILAFLADSQPRLDAIRLIFTQ
ncbi:MAG: RNA polymerase-associated protein RapA [Bdellovibrionales bacterium]|nr:RNA polymerase-associated protein RapA [Bdellovibrionales bacterium]